MLTMEAEENYNQKVQQPDEDDEEEEETLSLCDLPIYSNGADDYSVSASSSSLDDSEMDVFEFLSRDTSIGSSEKSIIFCGKLITYKESEQFDDDLQAETETREEQKTGKRRRWSLFRPKSSVNLNKSVDRESRFASNSNDRATTSSTLNKHNTGKSLLLDASRNQQSSSTKKSGFSVREQSVLYSTRSRSRWNLIMFGLLKFPSAVGMELSDIRSRQKRRNPAVGILTPGRGEEKTKTVNGLWSLIRSLSCNGGLAVSAVVPGTGFLY